MSLLCDASPHIVLDVVSNINMDILQKVEGDLDIGEKISILFLLVNDYSNSFKTIFDLFNKAKNGKKYILTDFIKDNPSNWENKLIEAICVCNNRQVIKKLGISFDDVEIRYMPKNRLFTRYLNPIAKCLYILCECLNKDDTQRLLSSIKQECKDYDPMLENVNYLELHLLYLMDVKYISIFSAKEGNLKSLIKHLKTFDDTEMIVIDLERYHQHKRTVNTNNCINTHSLETEMKEREICSSESNILKIKTGLCIIINQIDFQGTQYENRYGTYADSVKLCQTFKGLGFTVHISEDLTAAEMLDKIRTIPEKFGTDYNCIFLCILSHGCQGGILAVNEVEVTIDQLDKTLCCPELKNVIKIIIIQACQGKITGKAPESLTTDGLKDTKADITLYRNFCIFMSTMQGFVSVRDMQRGSWFIQELCNIIQTNKKPITFLECVTKVIRAVQNKRGTMDGETSIAQLPELRLCRLDQDFELPLYSTLRNA